MPQLILHPWFFIFMVVWLSFFIFTPGKIPSYIFLNSFTVVEPNNHQSFSWSWPWL